MGGWWRWAPVSPDGVTPNWMVGVSASVNIPLHHKVQKFPSGTGSPGWSQKKGRKKVVGGYSVTFLLLWVDQYFFSHFVNSAIKFATSNYLQTILMPEIYAAYYTDYQYTLKDQKQSSRARKNTLEKKQFTIKTQSIEAKVQW